MNPNWTGLCSPMLVSIMFVKDLFDSCTNLDFLVTKVMQVHPNFQRFLVLLLAFMPCLHNFLFHQKVSATITLLYTFKTLGNLIWSNRNKTQTFTLAWTLHGLKLKANQKLSKYMYNSTPGLVPFSFCRNKINCFKFQFH